MTESEIAIQALAAARESANWAFWSMWGAWFSGIATFAAVLASLFIALRKPKSFVKGKVRLGRIFSGEDDFQVLAVTVVSLTLHTVKLSYICWMNGKDHEFQQLFQNAESDKLPIRLEHGDEANYRIILRDEEGCWFNRIAKRLLEANLDAKKLKCFAVLSTGERFELKINNHVKVKISQTISDLS